MQRSILIFTTLISLFCFGCIKKTTYQSPNGEIEFSLSINNKDQLIYQVFQNNKPILHPSVLGLTINGENIGEHVKILSEEETSITNDYPVKGNYSHVKNTCNLITFNCQSNKLKYSIEVKIFDHGIGFRYLIDSDQSIRTNRITAEHTTFGMNKSAQIWFTNDYEGKWRQSSIEDLKVSPIALPVLAEYPEGQYVMIAEAMCTDYLAVGVQKVSTNTFGLTFNRSKYHQKSMEFDQQLITPWRAIMINKNLNALVNNSLIYDLADAPSPTLANADWIKPGRSGWTWVSGGFKGQNFENMKRQMTALGKIGWEYMIIDDGWEHWDNKWEKVEQLTTHGDSLGIKVLLWKPTGDYKAKWQEKFGELDTIRGLLDNDYRKHFFEKAKIAGVAGFKIDFVNDNNLERINIVETILKETAALKMVVNFHGCNKPSGIERTYPNQLVVEAVRGLEHVWNDTDFYRLNTILPFTRYVIGAGDYTPVLGFENQAGTRAHQLATAIAINAPLNAFAISPEKLLQAEELALLKELPTTWDETKVLSPSKIGLLSVIAKRKGEDWYLSVIGSITPNVLSISLNEFLPKGKYEILAFSDTKPKNDVTVTQKEILSSEMLTINTKVAGGFAARFIKK